MEDVKKKKRRRKKTVVKQPEKIPTMEEREKSADAIKSVKPPIYSKTGTQRLNDIPDYTLNLNPNTISKTIAACQQMTITELNVSLADPNNTVMESNIIALTIRSIKESGSALSITKYLHDRMEGKVKERIEYSGPNGGPIETVETKAPKFDVKSMDKATRDKFKKALLELQKMPMKEDDEPSTDS